MAAKKSVARKKPTANSPILREVRSAAALARDHAKTTRDPFDVGCARVLDALELVIRRHDDAAAEALTTIETGALKYIESRKPSERWYGKTVGNGADGLPAQSRTPRKSRGVADRAPRMKAILDFAEKVAMAMARRKSGKFVKPEDPARMMVSVVRNAHVTDTSTRDREADIERLTKMIKRASKPGAAIELTAELLTIYALRACGVKDAPNWIPERNPSRARPR